MTTERDRASSSDMPAAPAAEDPWAKWRKPATVDAPPEAKSEERPKTAPSDRPRAARPPASSPAKPSGSRPAKAPVARSEPVAESVTPVAPPPRDLSGTLTIVKKPAPAPAPRSDAKGKVPGKAPARSDSRSGSSARSGSPSSSWAAKKPGFSPSTVERAARPAARPSTKPGVPFAKPASQPETPTRAVPHSAGEEKTGVRLSKVMSERGLCSRREADAWIERGWVFVDGACVSELGSRIDPQARIEISREAEKDQAKSVTVLLHKPVGYVSGQPEPGCTPAVTLISAETQSPQSGDPVFKPWMLRGLAPAGRLDVDSTGLLVLTQDGRIARTLIGENSDVEKEYLVRVRGQMVANGLELLRHGLSLDGKPLKPAWVKQLNEDQLHFILKEGKKRQIRRMCELVGLQVVGLKRVRIGRVRLGDLPLGQWRFLRSDERF